MSCRANRASAANEHPNHRDPRVPAPPVPSAWLEAFPPRGRLRRGPRVYSSYFSRASGGMNLLEQPALNPLGSTS